LDITSFSYVLLIWDSSTFDGMFAKRANI